MLQPLKRVVDCIGWDYVGTFSEGSGWNKALHETTKTDYCFIIFPFQEPLFGVFRLRDMHIRMYKSKKYNICI